MGEDIGNDLALMSGIKVADDVSNMNPIASLQQN
jgi:hypothetical protein